LPACEPVVESRFKKPAHTDTDSTTCLHVPSIGLAICGDALYNDVYPHLGESGAKGRKEWIAALDTIESLKSVAAIAGTKRPARPIRQTTSKRHENTFAIWTGLFPRPRTRVLRPKAASGNLVVDKTVSCLSSDFRYSPGARKIGVCRLEPAH
jgi:hypothetical protein